MPMREENIQISFRGERRSGGVGGGIVVVVCASISAHVKCPLRILISFIEGSSKHNCKGGMAGTDRTLCLCWSVGR